MFAEYGEDAHFLLVYIREAHPVDGWRTKANDRAGINVKTPKTQDERDGVATTCVVDLGIDIPAVVDGMDDATEKAYGAWPDRLFVVGADGELIYRGGMGPRGFEPADAEKALRRALGKPAEGGVVKAKPKRGRPGR